MTEPHPAFPAALAQVQKQRRKLHQRELISVLVSYICTYTFNSVWKSFQECNPGCASLWDYTYTPESTLTLLSCFRIYVPKNYTYTYTFHCFRITNVIRARPRVSLGSLLPLTRSRTPPDRKSPKITEKIQNPLCRSRPEKGEKIRKYPKLLRNCNFSIFADFTFFRAWSGGGDF